MEEREEGRYTFDYIKDDPCYGCKYAVRIPDSLLPNPWIRRFGCSNRERRDSIVRSAKIFLERNSDVAVEEAKRNLDVVVGMDRLYKKYGFMEAEFVAVGNPGCYVKIWNDQILDAVEEIKRVCDVHVRENISSTSKFFDLPLEILRVLRDEVKEQPAKACLKKAYEMAKAVFDDLNERYKAGVDLGFYNDWRELANKIMKLVPKTIFADETGEKVELKFKYKVMRQKFGEKWNIGENEGKSICIYQTNVYSDAEKFIVDDIADMKAKWPELGEMRAGGLCGCKWWNMGDIEFGVEYQISTDDEED